MRCGIINADHRACAAKWAIRPDTLWTCSEGVCVALSVKLVRRKPFPLSPCFLCRKTIIRFPRWTHVWIEILDAGWLLLTKHELRLHIPTRFALVLIRSSLVMPAFGGRFVTPTTLQLRDANTRVRFEGVCLSSWNCPSAKRDARKKQTHEHACARMSVRACIWIFLFSKLRSMQSGARGIQAVKKNAKHTSRFFVAFSGGGRQKIEPRGVEEP